MPHVRRECSVKAAPMILDQIRINRSNTLAQHCAAFAGDNIIRTAYGTRVPQPGAHGHGAAVVGHSDRLNDAEWYRVDTRPRTVEITTFGHTHDFHNHVRGPRRSVGSRRDDDRVFPETGIPRTCSRAASSCDLIPVVEDFLGFFVLLKCF